MLVIEPTPTICIGTETLMKLTPVSEAMKFGYFMLAIGILFGLLFYWTLQKYEILPG
jgi:hypothetical protein